MVYSWVSGMTPHEEQPGQEWEMEHQFLQPHCPEHSSVWTQRCRFIHLGFLTTIRHLLTQECYREFTYVQNLYSLMCEPMGPERVYGCSFCLHKVDCNTVYEKSSLD